MKILLLNRSYYPNIGGIENSLYYLSREYKEKGHDVTILTGEVFGDYSSRKEYANIIYINYYLKNKILNKLVLPILPFIYKMKMTKWIEKNKTDLAADVVICRDPMLGLAYLKIFPKIKLVYIPAVIIKYYNSRTIKMDSLKRYIKEMIRHIQLRIEEKQQKKIINLSKKVLVFSLNVKKQILTGKLCMEKEKIEICYPGVADKFILKKDEKRLNIENITFLFVGRLVYEKNVKMLIDAFSKLNYNNKKLILVGEGEQRDELERQVKSMSLSEKVTFTGKTNNPEKYYKQADFLVVPSSYESFGQVIIEALSSGVPVIGFSTIEGKTLTAIDELIKDNITGFICNEFSCESLKLNMEKAISIFKNQEKIEFMRKSAIKFSMKNCSWNNLSEKCIHF